MELTLKRKYFKPTYTIGKLYVNGVYTCDTLEDKDRGLTRDMPTTEIYKRKVYGATAIPKGKYRVDMDTVSPRFGNRPWARPYGGKLPRLVNVPCWEGVLLHVGNSPADSTGCVLPGFNKAKGKVLDSTRAFYDLMDKHLVPAHNRKEEIWLTIE